MPNDSSDGPVPRAVISLAHALEVMRALIRIGVSATDIHVPWEADLNLLRTGKAGQLIATLDAEHKRREQPSMMPSKVVGNILSFAASGRARPVIQMVLMARGCMQTALLLGELLKEAAVEAEAVMEIRRDEAVAASVRIRLANLVEASPPMCPNAKTDK